MTEAGRRRVEAIAASADNRIREDLQAGMAVYFH